jgi:cation transport regulator ChaB
MEEIMKYYSFQELPKTIRSQLPSDLPKDLQELYLNAFNNSLTLCKVQAEKIFKADHEKTAHAIAWNTVIKSQRCEEHPS